MKLDSTNREKGLGGERRKNIGKTNDRKFSKCDKYNHTANKINIAKVRLKQGSHVNTQPNHNC